MQLGGFPYYPNHFFKIVNASNIQSPSVVYEECKDPGQCLMKIHFKDDIQAAEILIFLDARGCPWA